MSHGCPSALFRGVNVLNATEEAGSGEPVDAQSDEEVTA